MAKRKRLGPALLGGSDAAQMQTTPEARRAPPIAHVAGEASSTAALHELSETLRLARSEGRMIQMVPLAQINETYLARDRISADPAEMEALKQSITARGQQTPIDLVELAPGRYGLISGWRRCQALRALGMDAARALVTQPREASDAYVAMVEENEIRVGLSYFERAQLVLRSVDLDVFDSHKSALQALFSTASRAKRSKIKSFISVVDVLGDHLQFPAQLGERLGLSLAKALAEDPGAGARLRRALDASEFASFEIEQAALNQSLNPPLGSKSDAVEVSDAPGLAPRDESQAEITLERSDQGALTLTGPGVTEAFCADLEAWLKTRR